MYAIGALAKRTGLKVATIRYYEQVGLLNVGARTTGNQRLYNQDAIERISFIKHARDLGFSIKAISDLIVLQEHPDRSSAIACYFVRFKFTLVYLIIKRLQHIASELNRISSDGEEDGSAQDYSLQSTDVDHRPRETFH
jgi:DNA-binding transcriptional MerR regulator